MFLLDLVLGCGQMVAFCLFPALFIVNSNPQIMALSGLIAGFVGLVTYNCHSLLVILEVFMWILVYIAYILCSILSTCLNIGFELLKAMHIIPGNANMSRLCGDIIKMFKKL
ncbi:MAG: hypothetical protein MHPSP_000263 [Paramarteilia canceri]